MGKTGKRERVRSIKDWETRKIEKVWKSRKHEKGDWMEIKKEWEKWKSGKQKRVESDTQGET